MSIDKLSLLLKFLNIHICRPNDSSEDSDSGIETRDVGAELL